jgi:hypothetical protein
MCTKIVQKKSLNADQNADQAMPKHDQKCQNTVSINYVTH